MEILTIIVHFRTGKYIAVRYRHRRSPENKFDTTNLIIRVSPASVADRVLFSGTELGTQTHVQHKQGVP